MERKISQLRSQAEELKTSIDDLIDQFDMVAKHTQTVADEAKQLSTAFDRGEGGGFPVGWLFLFAAAFAAMWYFRPQVLEQMKGTAQGATSTIFDQANEIFGQNR